MNLLPKQLGNLPCLCCVVVFAVFATKFPSESLAKAHKVDDQIRTDLLIVGGTESGWAAAIQAARLQTKSIVIVHDGKWLGGQFTEQALACVDENKGVGRVGWGVDWHPMKRSFHRSGLFKELMVEIEDWNQKKYGRRMPGRPYHGPSTFRPAEAEAIFRNMIQPYIDSGQVKVIWNSYPVGAKVDRTGVRPRLTGLRFRSLTDRKLFVVDSKMTIDASDWGEAIQVAGAEFEVGPDPQSRYGESEAPKDLSDYPPNEMNPITWAMIVEENDNARPIDRPKNFDDRCYNRTTIESLTKMKGLDWDRPVKLSSIPAWPDAGKASARQLSVYNVRRLVDGYKSKTGKTVVLLNYMLGQDYPLERLPAHVVKALEANEKNASDKNIVEMTREQREIVFEDAKQHALGVLFHLQNFVHDAKKDKTHSFRSFELSQEFGTPDRLPPKPYIRESLRLKAMYMMREQDGRNTNGPTKRSAKEQFAQVMYHDGIMAWQFHYDFHRTGRAYLKSEGTKGPWIDFEKTGRNTHILSDRSVFPLRSLIPIQMDGLMGAQKNVGYSSIVSAAIRLHDQCIHLGQAAGATAAYCLQADVNPRQVPFNAQHLECVRRRLCGNGTGQPLLIFPFRDLATEHPNFVAINRLAVLNVFPLRRNEIDFKPEDKAESIWIRESLQRARRIFVFGEEKFLVPTEAVTRGEFAQLVFNHVEDLELVPLRQLDSRDADMDGIPNRDDALPYDASNRSWPKESRPGFAKITVNNDGILPLPTGREKKWIVVDFNGKSTEASRHLVDIGQRFDAERGFGWNVDLSKNVRRRNGEKELPRNSFVFTRSHHVWQLKTEAKKLLVRVCIGDLEHEQFGQNVSVQGIPLLTDVTTPAGKFVEKGILVGVDDGKLTIEIGLKKSNTNTCLNWIQIEELE